MQTTGLKGAHLSLQQRRLWALQPASQSYRCQCAAWLNGALVWTIFLRALQHLVDQHEILRTVFQILPGMDVPFQVIGHHFKMHCPMVDLKTFDPTMQQHLLDYYFADQYQEQAELSQGPLLRVALFQLSPDTHLLLLGLPAFCADAPTLLHLITELCHMYQHYQKGESPDNAPLQYITVSTWQNKMLESENAKTQQEFWHKTEWSRLHSALLPFQYSNGSNSHRLDVASPLSEGHHLFIMDEAVTRRLIMIGQHAEISLMAVLLTCWLILLWRLTGEEQQIVGVACDGRMYDELKQLLGLYTRFIPFDSTFHHTWTFEQTLHRVSQALQEATKHQVYFCWPEEVSLAENHEHPAFFPTTFEFEQWPSTISTDTLSVSLWRRACCIEPTRLKLTVLQTGTRLQLELQSAPQSLSNEQLHHLASTLQVLLSSVSEQPQAKIGILAILAVEEQQFLRQLAIAPTEEIPAQGLHQLFEEQALRVPEQLAVVSSQEQLTYEQLNCQANQLAHWLRRQGVGPNVLVAVCFPRSVQILVAILAILKAGGAYVPLEPEQPAPRLLKQLQQSRAILAIVHSQTSQQLAGWDGQVYCLDQLQNQLGAEKTTNPASLTHMDDPAYVIYTSGSTGTPKGVIICHRAIVNYLRATRPLLADIPGLHFAIVSTMAADLGHTVTFGALASGGCLHILAYETATNGLTFAQAIAAQPIDVLKIVPSHLAALLESCEDLPALPRRTLVLGGEALPPSLLLRIKRSGGRCTVFNHYGPTECTVGALVKVLGQPQDWSEDDLRAQELSTAKVSIGQPLTNLEAFVLDRQFQLTPIHVRGELYLGGAGLAQGYLDLPEQTAERFIPHPFSHQPGARLYRTGDQACYIPRGEVTYLGRLDNQVKLRGYRIEPGEIEVALVRHPNVRSAVAVLREDEFQASHLVAYIVPRHQPAPSLQEITHFLQEQLPLYMLPSALVSLPSLPLTANGKLDVKALPPPQYEAHAAQALPRNPVEEILVSIWKEILRVESVGIDDNFFALGGHSLLATQIIARMRTIFSVELPLRDFFGAPTIRQLAEQIKNAQRGEYLTPLPPLVPRSPEIGLPLSFAQQRLWFLDQFTPGDISYNLAHAFTLRGELSAYALYRALKELVRRHESLRTVFPTVDGYPQQVILPATSFTMQFYNLSNLPVDEAQKQALLLANQESLQPFDLAHGPLLRTSLVRLQNQEHALLLTMHHIITDGWSNDILFRELDILYHAFTLGQSSPLPPLAIQYADYALWQRQWLQGERLQAQLDYWQGQLTEVSILELPADFPRPAKQSFRGSSLAMPLPASLYKDLALLSQRKHVTLFMLLLTAFATLLARYSQQSDICIGTAIANRSRAELEGLIGFFVNTLVMRCNLSGNPAFTTALEGIREVALQAYAHQDVPFEQLVEMLQPERDLSHSPLFQVMFNMQYLSGTGAATGETQQPQGPTLGELAIEHTTTKFDLTLFVTVAEGNWHCGVEYSTDLFTVDTMQRFLEHWQTLLEGIVAHPELPLSELPLLTDVERHTQVMKWNETERATSERCLHTLFAEQVARTPDALAVISGETSISYDELNRRANQLAWYLQALNVTPEVLVGVSVERSAMLLICLLAVLKAGGGYLPLDPAYPQERLDYMLDAAQAPILLTTTSSTIIAPPQTSVVYVDQIWPVLALQSLETPPATTQVDNVAYVIYTSGSTGKPKGVLVTHRGISNLFQEQARAFGIQATSRILQFASLSFDASIWEIVMALLNGASLHFVEQERLLPGEDLLTLLRERAITTLTIPPSALLALPVREVATLETLIAAGEACSAELVQRWAAERHFWNAYGPTETTICASMAECQASDVELAGPSIGKPIANTQLYVLDQHLQPLPRGVSGELYIGGIALARGYLHDPAETAWRFIPHPFSSQPGARIYKTGDRARYRADGSLEYVGRLDQQVKVRGYRVEPGEIEAATSQHPDIREVVVVVQEGDNADKKLVAYFVAEEGKLLATNELRHYLLEKLPEPMVPSHFVQLDALPLTPNGKIDRAALRQRQYTHKTEVMHPRDSLEAQLLLIWREVLAVEHIGVTDNFFDLGGHSILAIYLVARILQQLGHNIPVLTLFLHPTIAELATALRQVVDFDGTETLIPIQPQGSRTPFFCIHPLGGSIARYYLLSHVMGTDYPFYGLQAPNLDNQGATYTRIEDYAANYIVALQRVQPTGPYLLGGWSMGGVIAFEMARQLRAQGYEVALVALLDSNVDNFPDQSVKPVEALDTSDSALVRKVIEDAKITIANENFYQFPPEEQLSYLLQENALQDILPAGIGIEQARSILRMHMTNLYALQTYIPPVSQHPLTLFRASDNIRATEPGQEDSIPRAQTITRGWETLTSAELTLMLVPGNHANMLNEPHVQVLAELLKGCIDRACTSGQ